MGNFIGSCTQDTCKATDSRVRVILKTYDKDSDGYLELEDFLEFYFDACIDPKRTQVVWSNLYAHHYKNDLSRYDDVDPTEALDPKTLPRYLLASNKEHFDSLFSLLDIGGNLAEEAWELINRLPTS